MLHPVRKRWRGYDQAVLLSTELARGVGKPVWGDVLARVKNTAPQIDLTPSLRAENVRGAFEPRKTWKLAGTSLLIVDDVYTTGATLQEAAKALKSGGVKTVYALTITRHAPDWHPRAMPTLSDGPRA